VQANLASDEVNDCEDANQRQLGKTSRLHGSNCLTVSDYALTTRQIKALIRANFV